MNLIQEQKVHYEGNLKDNDSKFNHNSKKMMKLAFGADNADDSLL